MGGVNVKNTIVEWVLKIIAPHPCSGCAKVGTLLCQDCKYNIINDRFVGCILCGTPHRGGICARHASPIDRAFVVAARDGALEALIDRLKFQNTRAAARSLAELLSLALPLLPAHIKLLPLPTIRRHARQRGYDHTELLVRHLAELRNHAIIRPLRRRTAAIQKTATRKQRHSQARQAFTFSTGSLKGETVLLVDDVITTGATVEAAAQLLKQAGATVWVAALAYQPLD